MSGSPDAVFPAGDRVQLLVPVLGLEAKAVGTVVRSFERLSERTYLVDFDVRRVELGDDLLGPAD
ncbi:MAG TPA: hypothetical protein VM204_07910 [Gaiellaceae bacterium]|nr:hypothetical protein [Gaiellaceae bacterium]